MPKQTGPGENAALSHTFQELSAYESKFGNPFAGKAYAKAAVIIAGIETPITRGARVPGIGKSSAAKIDEFLTTGKIALLENTKKTNGEITVQENQAVTGQPAPKQGATAGQKAEIAANATRIAGLTVEALKDRLRENNQRLKGNKADLIARLAEGMVLGAIPPCPLCGGYLKYNEKGQVWTCQSQLGEDYFFCNYATPQITRTPWKQQKTRKPSY